MGVGHGRGQPVDAEIEEGMADLQCRVGRGQKCPNLDRGVRASVVERKLKGRQVERSD